MATPRPPAPVLLIVAAFSQHPGALAWARERLEQAFGPVALAGPVYAFHHTDYYEPTMGPGLRKQLLAFRNLVAANALAGLKLRSNALERELAESGAYPERRPLNLDPGVLSPIKLLLATTKDAAHRVYLGDGIFAEATLRFHARTFEPWPWTYADYRQPEVLAFFKEARALYRRLLDAAPAPASRERERPEGPPP
jgi:hypothetical protein